MELNSRMTASDTENSPVEDKIFYWCLQGRANRPLQVYFYLNDWSGVSNASKRQWLTFAQSQWVISGTITLVQGDMCEWVVVKKENPQSNVVVASKRITIPGLRAALSDIPELS